FIKISSFIKQRKFHFQTPLIKGGITQPGDRVAAMLPNMPQTIVAMLACTSIGAVWSSCSPDFGPQGVLDRFGQIEPKLFLSCDAYWYNGKKQKLDEKLQQIVQQLPSVQSVLIVDYLGSAESLSEKLQAVTRAHCTPFERSIAAFKPADLIFIQLPFAHPLCILYSSGTTGIPKCIIHSAGGTLLQHVKEHRLHANIKQGDRLFYFSTCGWMMWNWLVSGLASGATLLLYDGSPFYPDGNILFDYAQAEKMTHFGTSAKYIDALRKAGLHPTNSHDLSALRALFSTGSPLSPEGFAYVYQSIKQDIHLASISGGTDIVSCFVLGVPTLPVWSGEIQGAGLGMAVDVWDDKGMSLKSGKGELVCTKPFPCQPIGFWNDPGNRKYSAAYFERFENIWCHGDFAERTDHDGIIIHGRSDATLNPGGVRIGTAEIYNQVEQLPEIIEAICIGQDFAGDVRIILFVRLKAGLTLTDNMRERIKQHIRSGASPRHVPAKIIAVHDIPRTKSGKISELAVRDIVHGRIINNKEALANPDALELYKNLPELQD
ncbi:acetoacetate--CoA ligase, partial [Pseudochrobactrum kiredjianiae]